MITDPVTCVDDRWRANGSKLGDINYHFFVDPV
jgi:hypothetical protein